ncbi:MAG: DUF3616 domain-containing protein [Paracoccus sp. (in: a-proteobacteria)]|uniref:DUF3616 domain-containing protein n=1 Tax=Paracoccus sp. TaxID=267 RepID=UPI0026DEB641|nr:DUF3616 domain-containing protein [Paracoccus sp. (in: a-proteobacteria)]MDO5620688.1 DUF3616 domain-containing protein [Paracoccus sp. (in: a-proteobacteria)]
MAKEKKTQGQEAAAVPTPLGSAKAVETMFRNSVRAELDMIQLAATKANIMISLNGLIISALMISGAFIFASSTTFLLPAGVFMLTAAASIIFALLAASPERVDMLSGLRNWLRDWRVGQAGARDLRRYLSHSDEDAPKDLNLLIYQDRVRMSRGEYWQRMQALLRDRDDIYHQMSDHLYWLGGMADRKFRLLNVSYLVFRWGLLASVLTFLAIKSLAFVLPAGGDQQAPRLRNLGIAEFQDIYEPSAVQQLPDGRILVVEDEASRALSLMTIGSDGLLVEDAAADMRLTRGFGRRLNDLEGLSVDDQGYIYTVTSHSGNKDGERSPDREQLLRFRIHGNQIGDIAAVTQLRDWLEGDAALKAAIEQAAGDNVSFDRLNIEGLAYYKQNQTLMLGMREPLAAGKSVIVAITNPADMFERRVPAQFGPPVLLDLQGGGIRALSFDNVLGAFLIVNEIEGHDNNKYSQLWSWSGNAADPAEPVALPDIINLNNVESIDSITINGESRLLLMSDEGDPKKNRPAKYMMLEYTQLNR